MAAAVPSEASLPDWFSFPPFFTCATCSAAAVPADASRGDAQAAARTGDAGAPGGALEGFYPGLLPAEAGAPPLRQRRWVQR